jgi:membrane-bound lytic murein transglycosylase D
MIMGHFHAYTEPHSPGVVWTALIVFLFVLIPSIDPAAAATETQPATSAFPRPQGLVPAIDFWTRIYSEIDSDTGLIHDDRRLNRVYRTLYLNPGAPPAAQEAAIQRALTDHRQALLRLAAGKRTALTTAEQQALTVWGADATPTELEAAAERVRFQRGQADRFRRGLVRSRRWSHRIRTILQSQGLPPALAAIAHVESSYNPIARSKAGAVGLWQFMPATARRYLQVDDMLDERLDPFKSTQAAALLLKQNHAVLKSWPLAITAYNHGLSGVLRAKRELGTNNLAEIVEKYRGDRFGFASRNFYAAFLAAADVAADPVHHLGSNAQAAAPSTGAVVPAYLPVDVILIAFGIEREELRRLNPNLHHGVWNGIYFVPKDYSLELPGRFSREEAEELLARLGRYFGFSAQRPYSTYEVRLGDSISVIAQRHNTSTAKLVGMNGLSSADEIGAGHTLRIPMGTVPEPLGAGAAAMLRTHLERGDLHAGMPISTDATRVLAVASGLGYPPGPPSVEAHPDDLGACVASSDSDAGSPQQPPEDELMSPNQWQALELPDLPADPVDYLVAGDGSIEIQIAETMGHYGDWLGMTSKTLRRRIGMDDDAPLIVGRRLKLDFSKVSRKRFEQQRIAFHKERQLRYFATRRIAGVIEHRISSGDNLWLLAEVQYLVPMWLLRQYNPDIAVDMVLNLDRPIQIPLVEERPTKPRCVAGAVPPKEATGTEGIATF